MDLKHRIQRIFLSRPQASHLCTLLLSGFHSTVIRAQLVIEIWNSAVDLGSRGLREDE